MPKHYLRELFGFPAYDLSERFVIAHLPEIKHWVLTAQDHSATQTTMFGTMHCRYYDEQNFVDEDVYEFELNMWLPRVVPLRDGSFPDLHVEGTRSEDLTTFEATVDISDRVMALSTLPIDLKRELLFERMKAE